MSIHSPGSNCEEDLATPRLTSYQHLFKNSDLEQSNGNYNDRTSYQVVESVGSVKNDLIRQDEYIESLTIQTHTYISGYVIKKLNNTFFKNYDCLKQLCTTHSNSNHDIITSREYYNI